MYVLETIGVGIFGGKRHEGNRPCSCGHATTPYPVVDAEVALAGSSDSGRAQAKGSPSMRTDGGRAGTGGVATPGAATFDLCAAVAMASSERS